MRSQGFLFFLGGLGVVDCLLVVLDLFFLSRRRTVFGKVKKGHVLQRVKVHFAWQAWGFVAVRRKLLRGSLALSMRKVRKGDVL